MTAAGARAAPVGARLAGLARLQLVALSAATGGCAMHSDVVRLQQQLEERRQESQRADSVIAANVAGLARLVQSIADSLAAQQALLTQVRGDWRVNMYNVQQQLVAIQELTGQSQQRLSELRAQLEQTQRQLQAPPPAPVAAPPAAGQPGASQPGAPVAPVPAGQQPDMREPTPDQLIDISLAQLRGGSPATARVGFNEFVRRYPAHPRLSDVLFYIGEAWAADSQADSAAAAYRAVVQRFPQSPRAASALYKLGVQALATGRTADARSLFARVVSQYPQSVEAPLAQDRLRSLGRP